MINTAITINNHKKAKAIAVFCRFEPSISMKSRFFISFYYRVCAQFRVFVIIKSEEERIEKYKTRRNVYLPV